MVRTQVQLTEKQARLLKDLAARRNVSVAELVRQSVDALLGMSGAEDQDEVRRRAKALAGKFRSGLRDLSVKHDKYFAESLKK